MNFFYHEMFNPAFSAASASHSIVFGSVPFNDIQTNVYGMKIIRRGKADATARGALMIAVTAMGIFENVEKAFECISRQDEVKIYLPDDKKILEYERYRHK